MILGPIYWPTIWRIVGFAYVGSRQLTDMHYHMCTTVARDNDHSMW